MIEKLHVIIPLCTSIIVTIVNLIQQVDLNLMILRLIFTIVIFYIFGLIIRNKFKKMFDIDLYDGLEIYNTNNDEENEAQNEDDTEISEPNSNT